MPQSFEKKKFVLVADSAQLVSFRTELQALLQKSGVGEKPAGEILVAVQEALTNVLRHSYHGKPGKIEIDFNDSAERIEVIIRDSGEKFNPDKIPTPELPPKKPGGLGLHLIKSLMDVAEYDQQGEGNHLRLVKYKKPSQAKK